MIYARKILQYFILKCYFSVSEFIIAGEKPQAITRLKVTSNILQSSWFIDWDKDEDKL